MSRVAKASLCFQRWTCEKCQHTGTVEHLPQEDARSILAAAEEQHSLERPGCDGRLYFGQSISRAAGAL